jgi:hypothetical protein
MNFTFLQDPHTLLQTALQLAGLLQILLLTAGAAMIRVVDLPNHLKVLPVFHRQLFWTYLGFTALTLVAFGLLTLIHASELARAKGLARGFHLFVCVFWTLRLGVQWFVFDVRPFLTNRWLYAGHISLHFVFLYLPLVHGWAFLAPTNPSFP